MNGASTCPSEPCWRFLVARVRIEFFECGGKGNKQVGVIVAQSKIIVNELQRED